MEHISKVFLLDFGCYCWILVDFCLILVDFVGFCWSLMGSTGFCLLLLDFVRFCEILQDFAYLVIPLMETHQGKPSLGSPLWGTPFGKQSLGNPLWEPSQENPTRETLSRKRSQGSPPRHVRALLGPG